MLEDVMEIFRYLVHPQNTIFPTVVLEMFISCDRDLISLLVALVMSSSRVAARTVPS
jgi:hypothetical protein